MTRRELNDATFLTILALVWFGLLAGVSFLATPVKFLAPSLSLPVALDVGRQTFAALNSLELALGMVLLALAIFSHPTSQRAQPRIASCMALLAIILLQTLWLLPALDARVETILQGGAPPESRLHIFYIAVDVIKLALLGFVASTGLRRLRLGQPDDVRP